MFLFRVRVSEPLFLFTLLLMLIEGVRCDEAFLVQNFGAKQIVLTLSVTQRKWSQVKDLLKGSQWVSSLVLVAVFTHNKYDLI